MGHNRHTMFFVFLKKIFFIECCCGDRDLMFRVLGVCLTIFHLCFLMRYVDNIQLVSTILGSILYKGLVLVARGLLSKVNGS